jgi:hypothetical protein
MGWLRLDPNRPSPEEVVSAESMMNCGSVRKVAVFAHIGRGNLGDEAIMAAIIQNVRLRLAGAEISAFTLDPADTHARHGVTAFPIRRLSDPSPTTRGPAQSTADGAWATPIGAARRIKRWIKKVPVLGTLLRSMRGAVQTIPALVAEPAFLSLPEAVNLGTILGARGDFPIPFSNGP